METYKSTFKSIEDAKKYINIKTNKILKKTEIEKLTRYYQDLIENSDLEEHKKLFYSEIQDLEKMKADEAFHPKNSPQGIDELIINLIEWRSVIYAFQEVEIKDSKFKESAFFLQWHLGAIYGIFSIFGKLLSKDNRDNSIRNLWNQVSQTMEIDGACSKEEYEHINLAFNEKSGLFTNEKSPTLLFRNKTISHNERVPIVQWSEVDKDISLIIRIWSLMISWSSFGLPHAFLTSEQAFAGIEPLFQKEDMLKLKQKRNEYIDNVKTWATTYAHTGEIDKGKSAFSGLSIKFSIHPEN